MQLSPAGYFVAYLRPPQASRARWLLPTWRGAARSLVDSNQAGQLRWSRDGRWLFLRAPRVLTIVGIDGHTGVRLPLGGSAQRGVMKLDPSQPAAILLRERVLAGTQERWRVVRMDVHGKRTLLREDARWVHDLSLIHI